MSIKFVTWQAVRSLGELQVLTRASYFVLVIVPMLAALWPGVRTAVNRYNEVVTDSTLTFKRASEDLREENQTLREELARLPERLPSQTAQAFPIGRYNRLLAEVDKAALELERRTRDFVRDHPARTLESPHLPATWAVAFFAALAVLLGHFIYQIGAPEIIRHNSLSQFLATRLDEYVKYQSEGAYRRAEYHLRRNDSRWIPPEDAWEGLDPEEKHRRRMTVIDQGARAEYRSHAERGPVVILGAGVCYLVGLCLIVWIIFRQARAVAVAAGWLS
ncbi:MAG TPA: hypothetical protein VN493_26525 [Thermoanaerobaculia bacterium]|nr:hypothetical protein [Thermoanaerobaculia bacterium]